VPPERRRVGLVFQDYALFPHLSVRDNIAFGLGALDDAERRARIDRALARIEMTSFATTYPHQLSGGQQQRVALARAVVTRPRVVLLDEPFSGLDARLRTLVRDDATQILRETGVATLMVTHDPEEAMYVADRIAVMDAGRLRQVDTPSGIYMRPADAFVAGLFGEVNRLAATVRDGRVDTPLGTLTGDIARKAVSAFAGGNGGPVEILVRQEALQPGEPHAGACAATVTAARYLGRSSLVDLVANGATAGETMLRMRVPGRFLPSPGARVALSIRAEGVFVFAPESGA
jgi:iron(III) transport system ATP-binding protein